MKDFIEWTIQEVIENFEQYIPEYEQLNIDFEDD